MSFRLISKDLVPTGGFPFQQGGDKPRSFPSQPMAEFQAQTVSAYRRANNLPRASFNESLEDVLVQTCARLGNSTKWCVEVDDGHILDLNQVAIPCKTCGAKV